MEKAKGSFVNVLKAKARRLSEVVWLQLRGRDLLSTKEQLDRCLVGKWGKPSISVLHLLLLRSWGRFHWNLKGGVKIAKLGGAFLFFEFEDKAEANRVLKRGFQCFKEKLPHLERWGIEVGCFQKGELTKEVWVRIVGLLLHFWSWEVFKKIKTTMGVYCSG